MKANKIMALGLSAILLAGSLISCGSEDEENVGEMREMTTAEIVKDMGIGINLGNTMEAQGGGDDPLYYEMSWGSPEITQEAIQGYKDGGFGVLRVPVAWSNMMEDDGTYTINEEYLNRVTTIIDWALADDLYVIMNIHWDGGWWTDFPTDKDECMKKYTRIWEQLSEHYKNYSDKLMFESLNEEGGWESMWNRYSGTTDGKADSFNLLNEINQKFVDIVRGSGSNNEKRHLLIAGYATDFELTCDELYKMPEDSAGRCAVSVHYYNPPTLCVIDKDADWGKARTEWGSDADYAELDKMMDMVKTKFVDNGVPVIIGEYGITRSNKTNATINRYLSSVAKAAYDRDMCPVLWDTCGDLYDRDTCTYRYPALLSALMAAKEDS